MHYYYYIYLIFNKKKILKYTRGVKCSESVYKTGIPGSNLASDSYAKLPPPPPSPQTYGCIVQMDSVLNEKVYDK